MNLNERQKKFIRRIGHQMHPLVTLGQAGLTAAVTAEMEAALNAHEIVKVKARFEARAERDAALAQLAQNTHSELVQKVGHMGLFYRPKASLNRLVLPD